MVMTWNVGSRCLPDMKDLDIAIVLLGRQQNRLSRQIKALYDDYFDYCGILPIWATDSTPSGTGIPDDRG